MLHLYVHYRSPISAILWTSHYHNFNMLLKEKDIQPCVAVVKWIEVYVVAPQLF